MQRLHECDADTIYSLLDKIGINTRALDQTDPSVRYLRELYAWLLHMQLIAWKNGRSHRTVVRAFNRDLASRPIAK